MLGALEWMEGDCVLVRGEGLRLKGLFPLHVELASLKVRSCPDGGATDLGKTLERAAYLPPMAVSVKQLRLLSLPPLLADIDHEAERWRFHVEREGGRLNALMDLKSGRWQVDGHVALAAVHEDMAGQAELAGSGLIDSNGWTGRMVLVFRKAGRVGRGPVADADIEMDLDAKGWRMRGELVKPVGFLSGWDIEAGRVLAASGTFDAMDEIQVDLKVKGPAGRVSIEGRWTGSKVLGAVSQALLAGEAATLSISGPDLALELKLPVAGLHGPDWNGSATFKGRVRGHPFDGTLTFHRKATVWSGIFEAKGGFVHFDKGGEVSLRLPWRLEGGDLVFSTAGKVSLNEGLIGHILVRPVTMQPLTELHLGKDGLTGRLGIMASGILSPRWILPPVKGDLGLAGMKGDLALHVPQWGTRVRVSARLDVPEPRGELNIQSPLVEGMAQGLNLIARSGKLEANGTWRLDRSFEVTGGFQLNDGLFDMGGVLVEGVSLEGRVDLAQGHLRLTGTRPLVIRRIRVGMDITDISADWGYADGQWELNGLRANFMGGTFSGSRLSYPAKDFETIKAVDIDLCRLEALWERPLMELSGRVDGEVPVRIDAQGIAVKGARFRNSSPLVLRIPPGPDAFETARSNEALGLALEALGNLHAESLDAQLDMSPDGWVDARCTIGGYNPDKDNLPVVFNYTHRENLFELLRSLRIGQEVTERVLQRRNP